MPKGRPKKIKTEDLPQSAAEVADDSINRLVVLENRLRELDEIKVRLLELETSELRKVKEEIVKAKEVETVPSVVSSNAIPSAPVPSDYVDLVISILNSKFTTKIEYFSDRPQFMFTIVVPPDYSPLQPDLRSKVLSIADGINGVRDWVNLVYSSFDPETKARIKSVI